MIACTEKRGISGSTMSERETTAAAKTDLISHCQDCKTFITLLIVTNMEERMEYIVLDLGMESEQHWQRGCCGEAAF